MAVTLTDRRAHQLRLTHAVAEYDTIALRHGSSDDEVVRLHFVLDGAYRARYPTLEKSFDRLGRHFSIFYARPFELSFISETRALETFGIQFPVARFVEYVDGASTEASRFCDRIAQGYSGFLREPTPAVSPWMETAIRGMLAPRYDGAVEKLYLLSQSLELLVAVLDQGDRNPSRVPARSRAEHDKLVAARELIDARLTSPPRLGDVARAVGLNEYKLKRGFRELMGTTVFGYLASRRLELARRLLRDTDKTASEIAYELGYATPQHFHAAFKRQFGFTPKSMKKNP